MQPAPQDNQLMSKHRVLSFKPHLRLEWRGQDGQNETEQPDHSASLGDSITSSTRIRFSVHTALGCVTHERAVQARMTRENARMTRENARAAVREQPMARARPATTPTMA